jgi:hypothetical protein
LPSFQVVSVRPTWSSLSETAILKLYDKRSTSKREESEGMSLCFRNWAHQVQWAQKSPPTPVTVTGGFVAVVRTIPEAKGIPITGPLTTYLDEDNSYDRGGEDLELSPIMSVLKYIWMNPCRKARCVVVNFNGVRKFDVTFLFTYWRCCEIYGHHPWVELKSLPPLQESRLVDFFRQSYNGSAKHITAFTLGDCDAFVVRRAASKAFPNISTSSAVLFVSNSLNN